MKNQNTFKPTDEQILAAETLFASMAAVQTIRPIVQKIQQEALSNGSYRHKAENSDLGEFVTNISHTYLMSDEDFDKYLTVINAEYLKEGFTVEPGYCPLLIAEDNERKAKRLLIDVMEPITKIKSDDLYCSKNWKENVQSFIDLTLRLLSPFVRNAKQILETK